MRDTVIIIKATIDYCEKEENYSYVELREYAKKNKPNWSSTLRNKNTRMAISEYLKGKRKELKKQGIQQPTLAESLNEINKKCDVLFRTLYLNTQTLYMNGCENSVD